MPGPISDSYDREFGTGSNAADVAQAIREVASKLTHVLGRDLKNIVEVVHGIEGQEHDLLFSERELRIMRFCLNRALESI